MVSICFSFFPWPQSSLFLNYTSKFYTAFRDRITKAQWYPNSPCIKCKRDVRGAEAR